MAQTADFWKRKKKWCQVLVAHACNPSHSGGREQEVRLKTIHANSSTRPYLKTHFTKIGLVEWFKVKALSSSPSAAKEKNGLPSGDVVQRSCLPGSWNTQ
jgi:hypothetical protein